MKDECRIRRKWKGMGWECCTHDLTWPIKPGEDEQSPEHCPVHTAAEEARREEREALASWAEEMSRQFDAASLQGQSTAWGLVAKRLRSSASPGEVRRIRQERQRDVSRLVNTRGTDKEPGES